MTAPLNPPRRPPYKTAAVVTFVIAALVLAFVYLQFRGDLTPRDQLRMVAGRAGLSMDKGGKVTFNGVDIGRVADIKEITENGQPKAEFTLDVDPKYIKLIPSDVIADIKATTVFGNKYVSFTSPPDPSPDPISPGATIDATSVTTEFNTLFETITSLSEQVDPVKLNATLSATAEALNGLGERFGQSILDGNAILDDLNPQMPQIRYDTQRLADLGEVYANAAPDLFDGLENAVTTARTLNAQRGDLDAALMAAIGFGNTGADIFERGGPYLVRGQADLVTTSRTLNEYSPMLFCTVRNFHDVAPAVAASLGGNGYSLNAVTELLWSENPYVYPDNLPRVNAKGGPHGKPGCWAPISRDLWPAPWLVMDTGASIAPYNHIELASPFGCSLSLPPCIIPFVIPTLPVPIAGAIPLFFPAIEYVWGRQLGEYTINP